jgi:D-arabinose 1-dehydrogenase-like Zn-dependent alcohol dehydrogenase
VKAVQYEEFGGPLRVVDAPEPVLPPHGAIIEVRAAGLCRSDWHGWQGHDSDIVPPQIPGHEWAGVVVRVGENVTGWHGGERVTAPFVCGCGSCTWCARGDQQVCERQTQPGFTHGGAFAERVMIEHADLNLVALPDGVEFATAAALGCRFATSYRAVTQQGCPRVGEWVAVHGCGGVGLSAVMIAVAAGARVVAVDVSDDALRLADDLGAAVCINSSEFDGDAERIGDAVRAATGGGVAVSFDAFGGPVTSAASVYSLTRRGRHVQVGLLPPAQGVPALPMHRVIGWELEIIGSHGMSAHAYPEMLAAVMAGSLRPDRLVTRRAGLDDICELLPQMSTPGGAGMTVIEMPEGAAGHGL